MFQCLKTKLSPREKEESRQDKIRSLRERIRRYSAELHELTKYDDDDICKPQETGCGGMCSGCE